MIYLKLKKTITLLPIFLLILLTFVHPVKAQSINKSAIVLLIAKDLTGEILGTGTGFIVKPEGVLVTNYHVLLDAASIQAVLSNGDKVQVKSVLKVDRNKDFALIQLADGAYSTLEIGDSNNLKEFDYLSALGFASENINSLEDSSELNEQNSPKQKIIQTFGFVLGVHPQAQTDFPFIYTTASFSPGFSGGPVVNKKNHVIGISTVEGRSINLALPINFIKPFLGITERISLSDLLKSDKDSKEAHYYRGNYYMYVKGDTNRAVAEFKKALKLDDSFVLAHYDLAAAYQSQGFNELAIQEYEKTLLLNPSFPEGNSNLGGNYFRMQKYKKAEKLFKKAIEVYPNFIQAHSNLGAVLNKLNRSKEALPHLDKATQLNPDFGIAYFNLGNAHMNQNNFEKAHEAYSIALKKGVDFVSLHWSLHKIYSLQGSKSKAKHELEIILRIDPENLEAQKKIKALLR